MKHLKAISAMKAQETPSQEVIDFMAKLDALAGATLPRLNIDINIFGGKNGG